MTGDIHVSRHELGALMNVDHLWITDLPANPIQSRNHILAAIAVAHVQHRHIAQDGVNHRQHPQLLARRQLIRNEIHHPDILGPRSLHAVIKQLRLHLAVVLFQSRMPNSL